MGPVSVPPWRTGSTPTGSTRHSARCRSRGSRTPRWAGPGSSVPSTPTCGWSGSWRSRSSCATPASRVSSTPRPRGSRCACSSTARGVSPRTSSSPPNGPRRRRSGPSASPARWRRSPASGSSVPPSRCTPGSSGAPTYLVDPLAVPTGDKVALLADRSRRLLAAPGVDHVEAGLAVVRENKFYADLAGTSTLQQRVRTAPSLTATTVDRDGGGFETMSSLAPPAARGFEYLTGTGWDWDDELARLPEWLAEKAVAPVGRAGPVRPGDRPVQPVADHPRVGRARHRVRPGHRLRGRLRGHQLRHAGPARHAALRLTAHARHRGPHGPARPGDHRLRRRRCRHRRAGTWSATGSSSATSWTARSPHGSAWPAATAAPSPTPRTGYRCSGWRTCRCSRTGPSTGRRTT